jgi:hypothetical protein
MNKKHKRKVLHEPFDLVEMLGEKGRKKYWNLSSFCEDVGLSRTYLGALIGSVCEDPTGKVGGNIGVGILAQLLDKIGYRVFLFPIDDNEENDELYIIDPKTWKFKKKIHKNR